MKKCEADGCKNNCRHETGITKYCSMHLARLQRHGTLGLKSELGIHGLEKLPHDKVDEIIRENILKKDTEIVNILKLMGFNQASEWNVKYRRRKLGLLKYTGKSHNAYAKKEALRVYGKKCEICHYDLVVDVHHIKGKNTIESNQINNLVILCPNCHALITRKIILLKTRDDLLICRKYAKDYITKLHNNVYTS